MLPPILDPSTIHPTKDRILAVRYTRPEMAGNIHIPASYSEDPSWVWWEVKKTGPDVEQALGCRLGAGDIVRTPFRPGIDLGVTDAEGRRLFMLGVEANAVNGVFYKDWED